MTHSCQKVTQMSEKKKLSQKNCFHKHNQKGTLVRREREKNNNKQTKNLDKDTKVCIERQNFSFFRYSVKSQESDINLYTETEQINYKIRK